MGKLGIELIYTPIADICHLFYSKIIDTEIGLRLIEELMSGYKQGTLKHFLILWYLSKTKNVFTAFVTMMVMTYFD